MKESIQNHATGDVITFLQTAEETDGKMSEFEMCLAPKSSWARRPRHFHPYQTETFQVISGELNLTIGKDHFVLTPDDGKKVVEKFSLHSFWNETDQAVKFRAEIYPPRNIEKGIRLTYTLAQEGKVSASNIPYNPMYSLILMDYFDAYFAYIPWKIQKFGFRMGANLARFLGFTV